MIFVTVGTHEQPFDRLVRYIDGLKEDGTIEEDVVIQTGYSLYEPKFCVWKRFFPYSEMKTYIQNARIVVTHGGPSSFIPVLQIGRIPVVVPRQKQFGEHVNDHQPAFCGAAARRDNNIIVVNDISGLKRILLQYDDIVSRMSVTRESHNEEFNERFQKIVTELFLTR